MLRIILVSFQFPRGRVAATLLSKSSNPCPISFHSSFCHVPKRTSSLQRPLPAMKISPPALADSERFVLITA